MEKQIAYKARQVKLSYAVVRRSGEFLLQPGYLLKIFA
jgi:hypothetical protein